MWKLPSSHEIGLGAGFFTAGGLVFTGGGACWIFTNCFVIYADWIRGSTAYTVKSAEALGNSKVFGELGGNATEIRRNRENVIIK